MRQFNSDLLHKQCLLLLPVPPQLKPLPVSSTPRMKLSSLRNLKQQRFHQRQLGIPGSSCKVSLTWMLCISKYVQYIPLCIILTIMKVGMTLYRLSQSRLISQIKLFRDMLALPVGPGNSEEGRSESKSILVDSINEKTFNFILELLVGK